MQGNPDDDRRGPAAADDATLACLFLCPNPTCDTELVVLPEQAGQPVECPTCGFRFTAPDPVPREVAARAMAAAPNVQEAKAAEALDSLASGAPRPPKPPPRVAVLVGGHVQYPVPPAPAEKKPAAGRPGKDRRGSPRIGVGERLLKKTLRKAARRAGASPQGPAAGPATAPGRPRSPSRQITLTWILAILLSAGLTAAGLAGRVPEAALGSVVFLGAAILRTVMIARRKRPPTTAV